MIAIELQFMCSLFSFLINFDDFASNFITKMSAGCMVT